MSVKIILYDRKNLLLDSFCDVLYSENLLALRGIFLGANIRCLNYP